MFGLRPKLIVGFGGLLLIMLVVSGLGIAISAKHRAALDQFVSENWNSVEYGQNMVDALDHLSDAARQAAGDNGQVGAADLAAAKVASDPQLAKFDENISQENRNITLPGEQEFVHRINLLWAGSDGKGHKTADSYRGRYASLVDAGTPPAERAAAFAAVSRLAPQVKAAAQAIIRLNLDNMTPVEGRVKAMTDHASRIMLLLAGMGVAMAVLFIAIVGRSILQPLKALTRSAQEIERGNLDLVVQVKSRDELHELAEAFNSMTAKLREYRRTNRAKLVRTQQTTQLAINSLPDAVAILSPDGKLEMANVAAGRLFSLETGVHVSESGADWLKELYRKTTTDLRPVEPRGYESAIQVLDETGGERFFLPHAVPILDEDRQLLGVTVVLADVTNLRRLDEMKSGMLSVVSHELKTPLTSIRMAVHLLLEERIGPLLPQQAELMLAARDDSDRLQQIIENLLDMGRMESGRVAMDLHSVGAATLVTKAVEAFESSFQDRGVKLTVDVPDDTPDVMVDKTRINHVLSNLLSNALKYTPPGGEVRVSAEPQGAAVRFTVSDTGRGIPQQFMGRIFERFFRVPEQSGPSGAGLGLAIAKEIVEAHGGKMTVESTEGQGSAFSFLLQSAASPATTPATASAVTGVDRQQVNYGSDNQKLPDPQEVGVHSGDG